MNAGEKKKACFYDLPFSQQKCVKITFITSKVKTHFKKLSTLKEIQMLQGLLFLVSYKFLISKKLPSFFIKSAYTSLQLFSLFAISAQRRIQVY